MRTSSNPRHRAAAVLAAACCGLALPGLAQATTVTDAAGDLLPTLVTYEGDTSDHSDLDVISASATRTADTVFLSSTQVGNVGLTQDGIYVWGVDRGSGRDILNTGEHPVGAGVKFDTFIVLRQNGMGEINLIDFATGKISTSALDLGAITISGATISVAIPLARLPSAGFAFAQYGYNVWPRYLNTAVNEHVSDFAPDNSTFTASVPEPTTWALMIAGFGLAGGMVRRRRAVAA